MRPLRTSAMIASPATTTLVFFIRPDNALLLESPIEITERPGAWRTKTRDHSQPEPSDGEGREQEDAGIWNDSEVEYHQRSGERGDERVDRHEFQPAFEQPTCCE